VLKLVKAGDEAAGRISLYFIHKAIERKIGPALLQNPDRNCTNKTD
jgi:hypothetical protein